MVISCLVSEMSVKVVQLQDVSVNNTIKVRAGSGRIDFPTTNLVASKLSSGKMFCNLEIMKY